MKARSSAITLLLLVLAACGEAPQTGAPDASAVMKIAVFADGKLTVDGQPSSVESLTRALPDLKANGGMVWYYREAANVEPHPVAMDVIRAVADAKLPIWMSTRPDFSEGRMASPK